ncbi:hypothetical protein [Candidatus Viridilinea mediisalina]|uniref:RnfC Barrel sandwich hybrid domain-containing protein n=1 Tax=Candidatus Viridilinea mediisalina TaxID=2024553 RepID=A0A2A6RKI4_9CHLR|nr:hypothetical protein [Candidatus Viridilinea mediisalina]PDW03453.1 hypothetical protein CJ255_08605 [Candidatus Viridilinea mediisalina]
MTLFNPEGIPPIVNSTMVRVERRLPYPGEILVRQGSRVEPEDIIARTLKPVNPQIINVARQLGIPPRGVLRAMRHKKGVKVKLDDVLARAPGLFGRSCSVPVSGMIADIDSETGYVTIAPDPVEQTLLAAMRGLVMDVIPYEGVILETPAAQIYGAFGMGQERSGVLRLLALEPHEQIQPQQIDAQSAYAILICGSSISAEALRRAVQEQVRGIIVGGIEEHELRAFLGVQQLAGWQTGLQTWQWPQVSEPQLTIVVTEGFGVRPMNHATFELLSAQDRQEVLIDGQTSLRRPLRRPRVIIPLLRAGTGQLEPPRLPLRVGATVRLLDHKCLGQLATVRSLPTAPRSLSSGIRVVAVEVSFAAGGSAWFPRTCVEVVS